MEGSKKIDELNEKQLQTLERISHEPENIIVKEEMKMIYKFDEDKYKFLKENPHKIDWGDFRKSLDHFPDYAQIVNPYLVKGSPDYWFWRKFFNEFFKTDRCKYNFIHRLVNSYMITGEKHTATIDSKI